MNKFLTIIFTLAIFLCGFSVQAEEYTVLVIPAGYVETAHNDATENIHIEEILADKLIKTLEESKSDCAPSMNTLKISIKNNSGVQPDAIDLIGNTKVISKSYGISKVILISSKLEVRNTSQQKSFWHKMDMPVLAFQESKTRIVTTVTMIDTASDDVIWSNVFYKNLDNAGNKMTNNSNDETKISAINEYYDKLTTEITQNMCYSVETSAILVDAKNMQEETKPDTVEKISTEKPVSDENIQPSKNIKTAKNIQSPKNMPALRMMANKIQTKYNNIVQNYENNKARKADHMPAQKVAQKPSTNLKPVKEKQVAKTVVIPKPNKDEHIAKKVATVKNKEEKKVVKVVAAQKPKKDEHIAKKVATVKNKEEKKVEKISATLKPKKDEHVIKKVATVKNKEEKRVAKATAVPKPDKDEHITKMIANMKNRVETQVTKTMVALKSKKDEYITEKVAAVKNKEEKKVEKISAASKPKKNEHVTKVVAKTVVNKTIFAQNKLKSKFTGIIQANNSGSRAVNLSNTNNTGEIPIIPINNINITPRSNSRNFTLKYDNSINDM